MATLGVENTPRRGHPLRGRGPSDERLVRWRPKGARGRVQPGEGRGRRREAGMLVHIVADYGHRDPAFAEVAQRIRLQPAKTAGRT